MDCFIGLDMGTSAVKGVVMTKEGRILGTASGKFTYFTENLGKFIDPAEFCGVVKKTIKELALKAGCGNKIAAICSCCASGDPVFLDGNYNPITPIISWQSACTKEELERVYTPEEQKEMYKIVGWGCDTNMPCAHFAWIKENKPEILEKAAVVTMSCEYLNWQLTGEWGIADSMATPSYLVDQEKADYSDMMLDKFGLRGKFLPPVRRKGTVLGKVKPEIASELSLSEDTVVVLGTFDHPSGAMGAGVLEEGEMLLSCGTSWVEFFPVSSREFALTTGGLVDKFLPDGAPYCVMKSLDSVADKINALKEHYFPGVGFAEMDRLIMQSELGCGGLTFNYDDSDFTKGEGFPQCHIARAIYESAAMRLKNNIAYLRGFGLKPDRITMVGGITNSAVIMGVISEVLGQELRTAKGQETGAAGSALLAGIGVGAFRNEKEAFAVMDRA